MNLTVSLIMLLYWELNLKLPLEYDSFIYETIFFNSRQLIYNSSNREKSIIFSLKESTLKI